MGFRELTQEYEQDVFRRLIESGALLRLASTLFPHPMNARDAQVSQHIDTALRSVRLAVDALRSE